MNHFVVRFLRLFLRAQINQHAPANAAFEYLVDLWTQFFKGYFRYHAADVDLPLTGKFAPRHLSGTHRNLHRVDSEQARGRRQRLRPLLRG